MTAQREKGSAVSAPETPNPTTRRAKVLVALRERYANPNYWYAQGWTQPHDARFMYWPPHDTQEAMMDPTYHPTTTEAEQAVRLLLRHIGHIEHEGTVDTPARVVKALVELTGGYALDPAVLLATTFDVEYDQVVISRTIPFTSLCEHHLLPFVGTCTIGYLPGARVVGLSKLARLVDLYARRMQIQERMTQQIATAIQEHLNPQGVGVLVKARHSCQQARGIRKDGEMVTSALLGEFRTDATIRAEFMALARD